MSFRCISVNSQIEQHEFSNTIYPQSILIEDINQDNKNEIIIGTTNGDILIYKGSLSTVWLRNTKQIGCITCMAYDNISDLKNKFLIVHDALGYVYFYSIVKVLGSRKRVASDISSAKPQPNNWTLDLSIAYQTKLLLNPKHLLIEDLYNNGNKKMIVGYTDRIIRVYNWYSGNNNSSTNNNLSSNNSYNAANANTTKTSNTTLNSPSYSYSLLDNGKFILEQTWELPDQVNSIHVFKDSSNIKHLIATQPGGHAFLCKTSQTAESLDESNSSSTSSLSDLVQKSLILSTSKQKTSNLLEEQLNFFTEINSLEIERSTIPTFLVTNINFNKSDQNGYLITMNGDVFFYKMNFGSNLPLKTALWHRNISSLVLKYYKVDINKDGNDELILATPEGQVFLINCHGGFICFDLGEPIRIFHLGYFSSELFPLNFMETGTSSEVDLHQSNNYQAFEQHLDASPISSARNEDLGTTTNNSLCFIYVSSITNKICLVQADAIISYSKLKTATQLRYKCENVFSHRRNFSYKINQLLDNQNSKVLDCKMIHDILYSN